MLALRGECLQAGSSQVTGLLPADPGGTFQVASDQAVPPVDALTILPGVHDGGITWYHGGGDFIIVGRHFVLTGDHVGILLELRPPIV
jgi:hypothetical protein